jgi:hypothetical protein
MKSDNIPRRPRRRRSTRRFFVLAVLIAVTIFAVIEVIQFRLRSHPVPKRQTMAFSATAAIAAASDSLQGFEVVLWRQGCVAGCPDYALHYAAGKLQYTGIRNVAKTGNMSVNFDTYQQHQLLGLIEQASFFGLGDDYTLKSEKCHPSRLGAAVYVVGVTLNGATKKVKVNERCSNVPLQMSQLARGIDKLTNSKRWTGVVEAPANATNTSTSN